MGESVNKEHTIRDYLLGRVADETVLEGIEERLFTDEEFCSQVALTEDELINDYVLGRLNDADAAVFQSTLATNPERRFKLELTQALREKALAKAVKVSEDKPSFFASLQSFFRQPRYVAAFAVILIAVLISAIYFSRRSRPDELAELRSIYKQSRPTETRISEFDYAPLTQLRGEPAPAEKNRLRRIENSLIEATEKTPNAQTRHALGVFYLTQKDYPKAIKEFETAAKLAPQNAKIHNDLGAAYFELAKTSPEGKRFEPLAHALEEFSRATELDGNLLEALFNKSLALQEIGSSREAKESWKLYLQKDSSSPWAGEARKRLAALDSQKTLAKPADQVLSDFLIAYRNHDEPRVRKIHDETKGLLNSLTVPLQLSRRYILAKQRGDDAEAKESLEALNFIGRSEQEQHSEFFFSELAGYYSSVGPEKIARLLQAKDALVAGETIIKQRGNLATAILAFEKSRKLFSEAGDDCEAAIAENSTAQLLPDVGRIGETRQRFAAIIAAAQERRFNILRPPAYFWLAVSDYGQSRFSDSNKSLKTALQLAESSNNAFEIQHAAQTLTMNYSDLGETEMALSFASRMFSDRGTYFENENNSLRNLGTMADLSFKLKFFSTSLSLSKEALSAAQDLSPTDSRVNSNLLRIVNSAKASGDLPAALKVANQSKQIAIDRGNNPENLQITAEAYISLADVKSRASDCVGALADYDKALDLYRNLPEFTATAYQIHKGKLFCFQQLNRREDFSSELETVLDLSEQYRATIREDDSRQAFFANEQDVFDAATEHAIKEGDSRSAFDFVEESRARSLLDFIESDKPIVEVEKNFAAVAHPLSLVEIQSRLPEQVQLVQYAVLPEKLLIWTITRTRFDLSERSITAAELEQKVQNYQSLVVGKAPALDLKPAAQELFQLLIPLDLAADKQICLVPDKSLHQLSFASLVSPQGKYLLEDQALFTAPSASVLVLATENARLKERVTNESLLSIGNPDFDREENPNLADLGSAAAEAESIAGQYGQSLPLLGEAATREAFLHNFVQVDVIHFAGHFVANRYSPGKSKLLFAGGEIRSSALGTYKLPQTKLVVLSACETGFERYDKGEGAIGIARTFLALGAPLVVATQWQVDSEPTKDLMIAFHRYRKTTHLTSAESLRRAQLDVLRNGQTQEPFYWAAFSLFGGYANY